MRHAPARDANPWTDVRAHRGPLAINGHDDGTRKLLTFIKVVTAPTP
jgi:hypothetical protein